MTEAFSLTSRHALVCGASAGIGRAAAKALASLGAEVTALARRKDELEALIPELLEAGAPSARLLVADMDDRPGLSAAVDQLLSDFGPIHILVNNSGGPPAGPALEADDEAFLTAFSRHVLASNRLVKAVVPGMREAGYGRIINVISSSVREPIPGLGVSNTIRGAVASWSKTLSRELPPGITINNVLPGYTATDRLASLARGVAERRGVTPEQVEEEWRQSLPEGRLGKPEELGAAIAFLASPAAAYIRGVNLPVDGGRLHAI